MSSIWGSQLKISLFGESHGQAIGVTIHNLPSGIKLDKQAISEHLKRRQPGRGKLVTARQELDNAEIICGVHKGYTTGAPLTAIIKNVDVKRQDYSKILELARPSHADYASYIKYKGYNDMSGGGHFSGRLTAGLVFAGVICLQILQEHDICIGCHIKSIKEIEDTSFDIEVTPAQLIALTKKRFPIIDSFKEEAMRNSILQAQQQGDSVGGTIECAIIGTPTGVGSPIFNSVESKLSSIMFSIPAVKGVEFGAGFDITRMTGSQANDELYFDERVKTYTNHNGGITGGLTNGMPIVFKVAIKPTPSIAKKQRTINMRTLENTTLQIKGRHDSCIVVRAVPCVESATAIAILDLLMEEGVICH